MTKRDILSIAFKILGVILIIYFVLYIPGIVMAIPTLSQPLTPNYNPYLFFLQLIISMVLLFAMACVVLTKGDAIAEKLIKKDSKISSLGAGEWERPIFILALRIIGVVCLIKGIPDLVKFLINLVSPTRYLTYMISLSWPGIIGAVVLIIIGVYLLSGGKQLVKYVFREQKDASNSDKGE